MSPAVHRLLITLTIVFTLVAVVAVLYDSVAGVAVAMLGTTAVLATARLVDRHVCRQAMHPRAVSDGDKPPPHPADTPADDPASHPLDSLPLRERLTGGSTADHPPGGGVLADRTTPLNPEN